MENKREDRILSVRDLRIRFMDEKGKPEAVRGVDLDLMRGETLAIVGESGSGKSMLAKAVMGILPGDLKVSGGSITFFDPRDDQAFAYDLLKLGTEKMRCRICGRRIAMVFQDPSSSLDPVMTIGKQIAEGLVCHCHMDRREASRRALELLNQVGIKEAKSCFKCYPHQLSGGMRQRVVIAIALSCNPDILICDEPTTALDVTVQARILELIRSVQRERNLSVIYITHDMGVVARVADRVAVMYAGKIVEIGLTDEIFYSPRHPYTWGLLAAAPDMDSTEGELYAIPGNPPDLRREVRGDAFARRSPYALNIDFREEPPMFQISETHFAATWLLHPSAPKTEPPLFLQNKMKRMIGEARR